MGLKSGAVLAAMGAALLAACQPVDRLSGDRAPVSAPVLTSPDARDVHSSARPAEARVTHVALDLAVDFDTKRLSGMAALDIVAAPGARTILLDTKGLEIAAVTDAGGRPLPFSLGTADPILGAPLSVTLNGARRIIVRYATAPDAAALQWLPPEQTAGKKRPYLFSQGEAILNRTWIPTQDSPGIRQTWEARLTVPADLRAVMSAQMLTPEGEPAGPGRKAYRFRMDKPVAPYLIALAVGDIAFRPLGTRTGVYTEPAMLERSASELVDVEKMVEAAESLYGPYRWGRYDLLVLPPSFPFGGMENPRLTFATPTILAGDRSLVSLVAHELAHSWSGNLVTNATWNDFWLNEGFTVYFENRIMEALYGPARAAMLADLGWSDMQAAIAAAGGMAAPDSRLHLDLVGRDPDEGMTDVAYEKGATFLRTIEAAVGRERFDAYLWSYFDRFAFKPQTSAGFLADLRANLIRGDRVLEAQIGLDRWVYQPGLPDNAVHVRSDAFAIVDAEAKAFSVGAKVAEATGWAGWTTQERVRFLASLPRRLTTAQLDAIDRQYGLSRTGNSEIRFAWLMLAVANHHDPAVPSVERFLTEQGRRKFVAPLFAALMKEEGWGPPIARRIYAGARSGYHAVTSGTVDAIVR
ncbi:aminopeptidase [Sphingomonas oleivorans]|uniref:Aminopeptidase N n=1 Tax=Sphingomonas oleivorans TaxID=1735121 RepID=A0A2T5G1R4_9SPHN|nr:M1 family metallopeptidase [Sphingomonas oleivorans]PTQ13085.1 aminopeptidase [Sphingomonas oleivorans]